MTLLKLDLVKRKVLLFVNSIESGFRMRLFLESFGLRSASINAELPMNSRHHILQVRQTFQIQIQDVEKSNFSCLSKTSCIICLKRRDTYSNSLLSLH